MDIQTGDRLQHHTGTIYRVHEKYPSGNCMIGIGSADRLMVTREDLEDSIRRGRQPYAYMEPCFKRL